MCPKSRRSSKECSDTKRDEFPISLCDRITFSSTHTFFVQPNFSLIQRKLELAEAKAEAAHKQQEAKEALPPGFRRLSEEERLDTLTQLQSSPC